MATAKTTEGTNPPTGEGTLHWLTLYEGQEARRRAEELAAHVAANVGDLIGVAVHAASLATLAQAQAAEAVTQAALRSDVIVVSLDEAGPGLDALQEWLGLWTGQRERTAGLFALWLGPAFVSQTLPLAAQQAIAAEVRRAGMDWVLRVMGLGGGADSLAIEDFHSYLGQMGNPPPPPTHWGINE